MGENLLVHKFKKILKDDYLLRGHLYLICLEKGFIPEKGELDVLLHLYNVGPIVDRNSNNLFLLDCVKLGLRGSTASTRNVLSKYTSLGILVKERNSSRKFNIDLLPLKLEDTIVFQYLLLNKPLDASRSTQD